jgi:hypothetical protein
MEGISREYKSKSKFSQFAICASATEFVEQIVDDCELSSARHE